MPQFRWIDPAQQAFVERHRLDDLTALVARSDGQLLPPQHRWRDIVRLSLAGEGGETRTVYVKRERARWKDLLRHATVGCGLWSLARAEFEILQRLAEAGIGCARPLVCLQEAGFRPRACLVLDELSSAIPVSAYLAGPLHDAGHESREAFFTALGREAARLHGTGISQPDLYACHVFVSGQPDAWRFSFLDFQRSAMLPWLSMRQRARDLASLLATLPRRLADSRERAAFLDAYLQNAELEDHGTQLQATIARDMEKLLTRRRIWEIRESDTQEHQSVPLLESLEAGQMWVDPQYRPALAVTGLNNLQAVMTTTRGQLLRSLPDRENWRLDLHAPHGLPSGAFLKRHHTGSLSGWLRAKVGAGPGETPGLIEARNVARLGRAGIAAMRLIAYGEKLHRDGFQQSFVITEELVGYTQLDHFLRERFLPRDPQRACRRDVDLSRLLQQVAGVAAQFHRLGYNHRDFYCCHFFIKEPSPGEFKVNLIDLQRVEHRRKFRGRWIVKDLAQLSYSVPRDRISWTQRLAFFKHYLGARKLRPQDKRLLRRVLAKQRLMERTLGAHP
jgi:tRNA A-37 threonylcarbamoyl transferase component Bud32